MGLWDPKWDPKNSGCLAGTQVRGGEVGVSERMTDSRGGRSGRLTERNLPLIVMVALWAVQRGTASLRPAPPPSAISRGARRSLRTS